MDHHRRTEAALHLIDVDIRQNVDVDIRQNVDVDIRQNAI